MSLSDLKRRLRLAEKQRAATRGADRTLAAQLQESSQCFAEAMRLLVGDNDAAQAELEVLLSAPVWATTNVHGRNEQYMRVMRLLAEAER